MIRTVIGLFVFALGLCVWIVVAHPVRAPAPGTIPETVTRADTPEAPLPPPAVAQTAPETAVQTDPPSAPALPTAPAPPAAADADLRALTSTVLANLAQSAIPPSPVTAEGLRLALTDAVARNRSEPYILGLIANARENGVVQMPLALITDTGVMDLRVQLPAGRAIRPLPPTYTVAEGDSLRSIAQALYGDGGMFLRLFEANRSRLNTPDEIKPGQVLTIPPL